MGVVPRAGEWIAWGSLGPLLLLVAYVTLDRSWYLYQHYPWVFSRPAVYGEAIVGPVVAVVGLVFIIRPLRWWWALVVIVPWAVSVIASDISVYGWGPSEIRFAGFSTLIAALTGFYALHCYVPGYPWTMLFRRRQPRAPSQISTSGASA